MVKSDARNKTKVIGAESEQEKLMCNKCNFISNKKITMNKHKNTKIPHMFHKMSVHSVKIYSDHKWNIKIPHKGDNESLN